MSPVPPESAAPTAPTAEANQAHWLEGIQRGLDRLLVADVFLVLAGALWFGLGVVLHLQGSETLLLGFQRTWPLLFQPAIGLLMAAALVSGGLGWWKRRGQR